MNIRIFGVFRGHAPIYIGRDHAEAQDYLNAQEDKNLCLLMFRDTDETTGLWHYAPPMVGNWQERLKNPCAINI